jgi:hypothetical protein
LFESGHWVRTGDQTGEEGLASEISVVLLEVLLAGSDELDSSELEAAVLEAGDDGANEATLGAVSERCQSATIGHCVGSSLWCCIYLDAIGLDSNEAVPNS